MESFVFSRGSNSWPIHRSPWTLSGVARWTCTRVYTWDEKGFLEINSIVLGNFSYFNYKLYLIFWIRQGANIDTLSLFSTSFPRSLLVLDEDGSAKTQECLFSAGLRSCPSLRSVHKWFINNVCAFIYTRVRSPACKERKKKVYRRGGRREKHGGRRTHAIACWFVLVGTWFIQMLRPCSL